MKQFYLVLFCFLTIGQISSQSIKGIVYDDAKRPIAGALVYLDGTSVGDMTDENGLFEIPVINEMYTVLVVNAMGYAPATIKNPFERKNHVIKMVQQGTALNEVTVRSNKKRSRFKRAERLKVFKEQFLGTTTAGKSCQILNESEIQLNYNFKKNRLIASSDVPIKIRNEFLGYDIEYRIKECYIDFSRTTVKSNGVSGWTFVGTTFFRDLTTDSTTYKVKRKMSYEGSQMQFFRNLCRKDLGDDNFRLLHGSRYCNPDKYFVVNDFDSHYIITVKLRDKDFYQSFILEYPGKEDSQVVFETRSFKVDKFGNNSAYGSVFFSGGISKKRIGDMLPLDYNLN